MRHFIIIKANNSTGSYGEGAVGMEAQRESEVKKIEAKASVKPLSFAKFPRIQFEDENAVSQNSEQNKAFQKVCRTNCRDLKYLEKHDEEYFLNNYICFYHKQPFGTFSSCFVTTGMYVCSGLVLRDSANQKVFCSHLDDSLQAEIKGRNSVYNYLANAIASSGIEPSKSECFIIQGWMKKSPVPFEIYKFLKARFNVPDSHIVFLPSRERPEIGENFAVLKGKLYRVPDDLVKKISERE